MTTEQWRDIHGYEDLYQVSNMGKDQKSSQRHTAYSIRITGFMYACTINGVNPRIVKYAVS